MMIFREDTELTARATLRVHGLVMACFMIAIAVQFLRPGETFVSAPVYARLAQIATEDQWGAALLTLGALRVVAIIWGARRAESDLRPTAMSCVLTFGSAAIWGWIAILFGQVNPFGWSCIGFAAFATIDASTSIMLARMIRITKALLSRRVRNGR